MLFALVKKELLVLSRDMHGVATLFMMPLLFVIIMSLALKDVYNPPLKTIAYAIEQYDRGDAAQEFMKRWIEQRGQPQVLPADWRTSLRNSELKYVIVIEPGFSEALSLPRAPQNVKIRLIAEPGTDTGLFGSTAAQLAALTGELRANALLERFMGLVPPGAASIQRFVSAERLATTIRPSAVQHNVPAWLIFGMFFVVAAMANLFVQERSCGTLSRLHSLGVPNGIQIAAKALPYLLVNALQAIMMMAVGVWLMPLLGESGLSLTSVHWDALLLILFAVSLASVSLALAVACVVRTHAQSSSVGPIINVLMAAIGGIMVPKFVMPLFMQRLAEWSPMNWGLEGLMSVLLRDSGIAEILPQVLRLILFAAAMLSIAVWMFHKRIRIQNSS
ncbi:MAG TPA: ABC transporter permease [Rhodocyclaceae bacterium]|nr:ABC transporter permease [Rhodocyclaceae bacterium]